MVFSSISTPSPHFLIHSSLASHVYRGSVRQLGLFVPFRNATSLLRSLDEKEQSEAGSGQLSRQGGVVYASSRGLTAFPLY